MCESDRPVRPAASAEDLGHVRVLFREYAVSQEFDTCFERFEEELAALPAPYAPPDGALLLAWMDGVPVGCVGVKATADGHCEMKRLYVRPASRGHRLGRQLAEAAIAAAHAAGYARMRLETLPSMTAAIALYGALGFARVPPTWPDPAPGALAMDRALP